jgi:hypothetical protein
MKKQKANFFLLLFLFSPFALLASEFQIKVINSAADLPEIFSSEWKPGDSLISDGKNMVLMGGTERVLKSYYQYPIEHTLGSVLGFVPAGKNLRSDLVIGAPYIRINNRSRYLAYSSFKQEPQKTPDGSLSFLAAAVYQGKNNEKAEIRTRYRLYPGTGKIDIVSTVKNSGETPIADFHYSLYFSADQVYYFSPFEGEDKTKPSFWVYPKNGYYLGWVDLNPVKEIYQPIERESLSTNLNPGKSVEARYVLLVDDRPSELLKKIYRLLGIESEKVSLSFSGMNGNLMEVVIQDASSSVFFRNFFKEPLPLEIALPKGFYKVRANFFPAVVEKSLIVERGKENPCLLEAPPSGKIRVRIRDGKGAFVPGKATFIGLDPTKTPYFKPENPIETKTTWESFKNSCYPQKDGQEIELPVGTYLVSASRGPEFTLDQRIIEVLKEGREELLMRVDRVIEPKNLISVDPHMHTLNSDGSMTIAERIRSVVAEGVDVAVSTDHNFLSDFPSALKESGLDEYLATLVGEEVSPLDLNEIYMPEFNRYPLSIRKDEPGNGAIDIRFFENNTPIFWESRRKDPGALIQVNHPRATGYGYFTYYQLDPKTAATALKGFDTSFDLLEVMNGPFFSHDENSEVIADWLHLLNRGYYFPIVGSSDSHGIDRREPCYARTYVFYKGEKGNKLDTSALIQAMKKGQSFVSTGPIIEFTVNNKSIPGNTITVEKGKVDVGIKVQSAPWISVDEVRVIINGERKIILPVKAPKEQILKFQDRISLNLEYDSYIAIEVLGNETLFPVVQRSTKYDGYEGGPLPYALTNPIFVDVDGNGKFDPPLPKIKLIF